MYVEPNFKTKKALKDAIAEGKDITVFQPNGDLFAVEIPVNGVVYLEGPHYPQPHCWYGKGTMQDGKLVKVV